MFFYRYFRIFRHLRSLRNLHGLHWLYKAPQAIVNSKTACKDTKNIPIVQIFRKENKKYYLFAHSECFSSRGVGNNSPASVNSR